SGWLDLALEIRGPACAALGRTLRGERGPWTGGGVRILLSGPGGGRRLRRRYLKALGKARRRIALAQAYFLPDRHVMRSLTAAARRGGEGRQTVVHPKAAAIDAERLLVGSFNLDPLSLVNLEPLVEVNVPSAARKV